MENLGEPLHELAHDLDQVRIMVTLLMVFIGVVVVFICIFIFRFFFKLKHEKATTLTALRSEIEINLDVTDEILKANAGIDSGADDSERCEVISMSETVWTATISSGGLSYLDRGLIESLTWSYAKIHRANSFASKIRDGKSHPTDGEKYNTQIETIQNELAELLKLVDCYTK